ncbi:MAG TPA: plastocyanin/azurin family copper-binding protein [Chloroflexota bacterium]
MGKSLLRWVVGGLLVCSLANSGFARAAKPQDPTSPAKYSVTVGYGDDDFAALTFTPSILHIYVGDSVSWTNRGKLEPHTVTFGPPALIDKLVNGVTVVTPQKAGPPIVSLNPQAAFPSKGSTFNGMGFANSGLLQDGQSWKTTFTAPGTYKYYCLLHYSPAPDGPKMTGTVVVLPRPAASTHYQVKAGYEMSGGTADAFFPEHLTVHVGDSVTWTGNFHTVSFASPLEIAQLRKTFIMPVPQKNGPPQLQLNPKVAFPAGGPTYDGSAYANSGLLLNVPKQSYTLQFTKAGTFTYACLVHIGMDGTVTVLP